MSIFGYCLHFILTNQVACNFFDVNAVHEEDFVKSVVLIEVTNSAGCEKPCNLRVNSSSQQKKPFQWRGCGFCILH